MKCFLCREGCKPFPSILGLFCVSAHGPGEDGVVCVAAVRRWVDGRDLIRPGLRESVEPLRNDMGTLRETSLRV